MKLRLSLREIRLIGGLILGVILLCAVLVMVSRHVNRTFFQMLESSARASGKIELAGMDRYRIRKKIDQPVREEPQPPSVENPPTGGKKGDRTPAPAAPQTPPVQDKPPPESAAADNTPGIASESPAATSEPSVGAAPYALHLASCRKEANCRNIVNQFQGSDITAYTQRVDLGERGIWHRVYLGHFASKAQARSARQKYNLPEARILKVR